MWYSSKKLVKIIRNYARFHLEAYLFYNERIKERIPFNCVNLRGAIKEYKENVPVIIQKLLTDPKELSRLEKDIEKKLEENPLIKI